MADRIFIHSPPSHAYLYTTNSTIPVYLPAKRHPGANKRLSGTSAKPLSVSHLARQTPQDTLYCHAKEPLPSRRKGSSVWRNGLFHPTVKPFRERKTGFFTHPDSLCSLSTDIIRMRKRLFRTDGHMANRPTAFSFTILFCQNKVKPQLHIYATDRPSQASYILTSSSRKAQPQHA